MQIVNTGSNSPDGTSHLIFSSPGQRPSERMPWCGVHLSTFSFKSLLLKNSSTECNQIWCEASLGKGNQFCINEGAGPPGARGAGPNMGNKGISFKDYS